MAKYRPATGNDAAVIRRREERMAAAVASEPVLHRCTRSAHGITSTISSARCVWTGLVSEVIKPFQIWAIAASSTSSMQ